MPLSLKSLIICKQLIKMGIWERICKGHWENCKALREQTKLPLDLTIRINDWAGRARLCSSCKGSFWSVSHLICINTSGMSESHKTVIMYGQSWPSLPALNLHTCIRLAPLERRAAGLRGQRSSLWALEPQLKETTHRMAISISVINTLPSPFQCQSLAETVSVCHSLHKFLDLHGDS